MTLEDIIKDRFGELLLALAKAEAHNSELRDMLANKQDESKEEMK